MSQNLTPYQAGAVACLLDGLNGPQGAAAMGVGRWTFYKLLEQAREALQDPTLTLHRHRRPVRRRAWLKAGEV